MRNVNSRFSVVALSAQSQWRSSWTGRLILVALLIAASALALMPDRTSAHHTPDTTYKPTAGAAVKMIRMGIEDPYSDLANSEKFVEDCIALLKAADKLTVGDATVNWLGRGNKRPTAVTNGDPYG